MIEAVNRLVADPAALSAMAVPRFPFGDGGAASRIAALALAWLGARDTEETIAPALSA